MTEPGPQHLFAMLATASVGLAVGEWMMNGPGFWFWWWWALFAITAGAATYFLTRRP